MRRFLLLGSVFAFLGVALGAFGAHMLEGKLDENLLGAYETGVQYQMYHSLGLIGIAVAAERLANANLLRWAGRLLAAGIVLFSGSLYALALTGVGMLGIITPFGGVSFLAGWACLATAAWKSAK